MRKIILFTNISLDGFISGPNDDIEWVIADKELHEVVIDILNTADLILYGRKTYKMMVDSWPIVPNNPSVPDYMVAFANKLNPMKKIVFSKTLETTDWNTTVMKEFNPEEIKKMKEQPGKNIIIGGANIAQQCMQHGLIDEFRLAMNPVILGSGKPLFKGSHEKLKLLKVKTFQSGVVELNYNLA